MWIEALTVSYIYNAHDNIVYKVKLIFKLDNQILSAYIPNQRKNRNIIFKDVSICTLHRLEINFWFDYRSCIIKKERHIILLNWDPIDKIFINCTKQWSTVLEIRIFKLKTAYLLST